MRNETKIGIYGAGCDKFFRTVNSFKEILHKRNIAGEVQEITDGKRIAVRGIVNLPTVFINGRLLSQGEGITMEKAEELLRTTA